MTSNSIVRIPGAYKPGPTQKESFSLCIYGRGGTGKTTLLGTMPGQGLIIDIPQIEGGTFVLEHVADRIDIKSLTAWDEIDDVFWFLKKQPHAYQWVAIDSLTAMTQLAIRKTIGERDLDVDPNKISLQDWGKVGRLVGEMIYRFRTLPIHTIWIAQERKYGNEEQGDPKMVGPDTSPAALQMLIPPLMLCGRLTIEYTLEGAAERHLRIKPHPEIHAKVRARSGLDVPGTIRNPHLGQLLKYLLGSGERPEEVQELAMLIVG